MTVDIRIQLLQSGVQTVANLARRTGIERTKLNRALNGDARLTADEQHTVAQALGTTVERVFGELSAA